MFLVASTVSSTVCAEAKNNVFANVFRCARRLLRSISATTLNLADFPVRFVHNDFRNAIRGLYFRRPTFAQRQARAGGRIFDMAVERFGRVID